MKRPLALAPIEPGTLLQLAGDDWSYGRDLTPGTHVDVVVTSLRSDLTHLSDEWLWVPGHRPECFYPHGNQHPPCLELRVSVAALHVRAVGSAAHPTRLAASLTPAQLVQPRSNHD